MAWTKRNITAYDNLKAVTYGTNNFVAVGISGKTLTSSDGLTWTSGNISAQMTSGVAFGANAFIVTGANGKAPLHRPAR